MELFAFGFMLGVLLSFLLILWIINNDTINNP